MQTLVAGLVYPTILSKLGRTALSFALIVGLFLGANFPLWSADTVTRGNGGLSLSSVREEISRRIAEPRFAGARWGILAVSLDSGKTLYAHDEHRLFIPASNVKLFTAQLAVERLHPEFRFRTSVYTREPPDRQGRVRGDLLVVGRGDPSFTIQTDPTKPGSTIDGLVESILKAGVRSVRGHLVVDDHYFSDSTYGAGWMVEDLDAYYSPEVSALSLNDNVATWRVEPGSAVGALARIRMMEPETGLTWSNRVKTGAAGGKTRISASRFLGQSRGVMSGSIPLGSAPATQLITVHDPASWFGRVLLQRLRARGVVVSDTVRVAENQDSETNALPGMGWHELGSVESPTLQELLPHMMKPSNNLHAQLFFLAVGAQSQSPVAPEHVSTGERSASVMEEWFRSFLGQGGLPHMEEGAGLSRRDTASAHHIVALLKRMSEGPWSKLVEDSLPIAGVDGTLKQRMRGTAAQGTLRAKTGTLRGVSTLSGFLMTGRGERVAFSILLNDYVAEPGQLPGREEVDAIATLLSRCEEEVGR